MNSDDANVTDAEVDAPKSKDQMIQELINDIASWDVGELVAMVALLWGKYLHRQSASQPSPRNLGE